MSAQNGSSTLIFRKEDFAIDRETLIKDIIITGFGIVSLTIGLIRCIIANNLQTFITVALVAIGCLILGGTLAFVSIYLVLSHMLETYPRIVSMTNEVEEK